MKLAKLNSFGLSHIVLPLVAVIAIGVIGTYMLVASHAATLTSGEPPHGLIIQVSTLSPSITPAQLKTMLDAIRKDHRNSLKPGYINSVVLQDIADKNGTLLTNYLDVLRPYLPGGATPAFNTAYIGTVDLPWTGSGSKYIEGIENADFRNQNVTLSSTVAQAFKTRYPAIRVNWYITYEANMAGFWDTNIETAYATYINQLAPVLSKVSSGKTFMWSPAFWTPLRNEPSWAIPGLQANIADLASKVSVPFVLNVQDFVGQSNGASTKEDAVTWMNYLKTNWKSSNTTFQINAEQFNQDAAGNLSVGDATEVPVRESYYVQQGYKLGPAWELRYWYQRVYGALPQ